jgi:hypothetical protein
VTLIPGSNLLSIHFAQIGGPSTTWPRPLYARWDKDMAQWKNWRHESFDFDWRERLHTALRLVRSAADRWALGGAPALDIDQVLAVLLQALSAPRTAFDVRPLDQWLTSAGSLEASVLSLDRNQKEGSVVAMARDLHDLLELAVNGWSAYGAETPPTEEILLQIVRVLFYRGLVRKPPPKVLDV